MHKVLLLGGGKIGRMIASFLKNSGDYEVTIGDMNPKALRRVEEAWERPFDRSTLRTLINCRRICSDSIV